MDKFFASFWQQGGISFVPETARPAHREFQNGAPESPERLATHF